MVLQYIRQHGQEERSLYVSADHTYFSTQSLVELADEFVKDGGTRLCIDEVHKMLSVLSQLTPFKPNMDSLAAKIGVSKNNVPEF